MFRSSHQPVLASISVMAPSTTRIVAKNDLTRSDLVMTASVRRTFAGWRPTYPWRGRRCGEDRRHRRRRLPHLLGRERRLPDPGDDQAGKPSVRGVAVLLPGGVARVAELRGGDRR